MNEFAFDKIWYCWLFVYWSLYTNTNNIHMTYTKNIECNLFRHDACKNANGIRQLRMTCIIFNSTISIWSWLLIAIIDQFEFYLFPLEHGGIIALRHSQKPYTASVLTTNVCMNRKKKKHWNRNQHNKYIQDTPQFVCAFEEYGIGLVLLADTIQIT